MMTENLDAIRYIELPVDTDVSVGQVRLTAGMRLPVEPRPGEPTATPDQLSWEMILSAMLKILAYAPDHEDADLYRRLIPEIRPDIVDELTQAAVIKAKNSDFDQAEEMMRALAGLRPDDQRMLLNLAALCEDRSRQEARRQNGDREHYYRDEALAIYRKLREFEAPLPIVNRNAGFFFLSLGNYERALHHLREYVENPGDDEHIETAKKALAELERTVGQDTRFKEAYDFVQLHREEAAIERISDFLAESPDVWNAWFLLGWAHRRLGHYQDAAAAFARALALGERDTDTLNEAAICEMELGHDASARKLLEEGLAKDPDNVKIVSNLGILALRKGDRDEARRFFLVAQELDPDDPLVRRYNDDLSTDVSSADVSSADASSADGDGR